MKQRKIANSLVGEIGLGCMGMSWAYGSPDDEESLKVLSRALELGVNHWDTADLYGAGENEKLLSHALKSVRDQVFLATKFGNVYDRSLTSHQDLVASQAGWIVDGTPEYVRKSIDLSLSRLQVEYVDLYYQHRVDDRVPIEETVGAMAELVKSGKVKALGLSEASVETIRRAHAVHPIAAVQSEFSLWTRDYHDDVIPLCKELGIAFVPYSPLGRGFLTGQIKSVNDLADNDWRRMSPRFEEENLRKNLQIVDIVTEIAADHEAKPAQIALAWVLSQGEHLTPIPGTKRLKYLEENAASSEVTLTEKEIALLSSVVPAAGMRYPEGSMSFVNR